MNKQIIRFLIYKQLAKTGSAPNVEELSAKSKLPITRVTSLIQQLADEHYLVLEPGTSQILMAHPFSNNETKFKVYNLQDNGSYFANCAWDAVAFHAMLNAPIRIESFCLFCKLKLLLIVDSETLFSRGKDNPIVYLGKKFSEWWDDILETCMKQINFFCSESHLNQWKARHPETAKGYSLSEEQLFGLCNFFYREKMNQDYKRPEPGKLLMFFRKLNLAGEFWELNNQK